MKFSKKLTTRIKSEQRVRGFLHLRTLSYRCLILDLVKICCDSDSRAPSIKLILEKVRPQSNREFLEKRHIESAVAGESDKELRKISANAAKAKFSSAFSETEKKADQLLRSSVLKRYYTVRNKLIAHNELRTGAGGYEFLDIGKLGLKYGQEIRLLKRIREVVDGLNFIVRNASFDWDSFVLYEIRDAQEFWGISRIGSNR